MTDATASSALAVPDMDDDGLGDFTTQDMTIPRINIDHKTAEFVDGLDGTRANEIEVIILGLVKQRVLWPAEVSGAKEKPLCRSLDFDTGRPDNTNGHARFPWKESGFSLAEYQGTDQAQLSCEGCKLKEWGTHPSRKEVPWCAAQFVLIVLVKVGGDLGWAPALLTFQGSGIKATSGYLTSFKRSGSPAWLCTTKIKLTAQRRGTVDYSTPSFVRGTPTDGADWEGYKAMYRQTRAYLQTPRTDEEEAAMESASTAVTVNATATEVATPVTPSGAAAAPADDDLPF